MIPQNYEARQFGEGRPHAEALAAWCGGSVHAADDDGALLIVPARVVYGSLAAARQGEWIVRLPDGAFRVDLPGSQDGYCADCGEPVQWYHEQLVSRPGTRWCRGPGQSRQTMDHWHALPGMSQYVVRSADGQVCHCLVRDEPHIHLTVTEPEDARLREVYRNMTPDERNSVLREMARELAEGGGEL